MNILVVGGTGLIGSAIVDRLVDRGHRVIVASRRKARHRNHVYVDLASAKEADWRPLLSGVDAVVNCAGVLQDGPGASTSKVHHTGIDSLFQACEAANIRRVVHFSAMGVDRETPSEFSRSKWAGDQSLMRRDLDWVILRPSVVIGRSAYGASALIRGLAALPLLPVMPNSGPLQIVLLEDVVRAVEFFLEPAAPVRKIVELVGPHRYSFSEVVALFRGWYRWVPAREIRLPKFASSLTFR